MLKSALVASMAFAAAFHSLSVYAAPAANAQENKDRVVDQASVDVQDEADADLSFLVKKYAGTTREAGMLLRLSELRLEIAESMFRVSYAPGEKGLQAAYRAKLGSGVQALSRILSAYPKSAEYARALYLRGKAQKELGENAKSLKDLEAFLARFSSRSEAPVAALSVADLCIQKSNYKRAISVLAPVLKKTTHPLYPNAVQKRAWAFYASANPMAAVKELRTLAAHFSRLERAKQLSPSDQAVRDGVMSDVAAISYHAFSKSSSKFPLVQVNALMRSYDTDAGYRRMALAFMDQLRTADRENDLRTWKAIVLKSDPARSENLEMLIATFEYDLERESYADVTRTSNEMAAIIGKKFSVEGAEESRNLVLRAAGKLTKRISDYRSTAKASDAEKNLASVMTSFDRMSAEGDVRKLAMRWNLAETYFGLERYESAAQTYRWVVVSWIGDENAAIVKGVSKKTAALKAISSRYEALRTAGIVPTKLEVKASATLLANTVKVASVREWIQWIDQFAKEQNEVLEQFGFEANRTLYSIGAQDEAMQRMKKFAEQLPASKLSVAGASLVVDTWIARGRWDHVEAEASSFASRNKWAKATFASEMRVQAAGAKFKQIEITYAAKRFDQSLDHAKEFLQTYPKSNLAVDANGFACNSLLNAKELNSAVDCFDGLAKRFPNTVAAAQALRTAARIDDEQMKFVDASDRYLKYLDAAGSSLKAPESLIIRRRVLQLTRASGDAERMSALASVKKLCAPKLEAECDLNQALSALIRSGSLAQNPSAALARMTKARPELRAVWAMTALEQWTSLDVRTLDRALNALVGQWKGTDASVRYFLIARVTKVIPAILLQDRTRMAKAGMAGTEAAITKRMRMLQALESRSSLISGIPVNSVQAAALETVFFGYSDLITDVRGISAPENANPAQKREHAQLLSSLTQPLILKSRKIRDSFLALDLKEKSGLSADSADGLFDRPVAQNASYDTLRKQWLNAIRDENWSRVSFLSNEVMDLKNVPANWSKAARAIALATAGAAAEAKLVFGDACRDSSGSTSLRDVCRSVSASGKKGRG